MNFKRNLCLIVSLSLFVAPIFPRAAIAPTITKQEESDLSLFQADDNKSVFDSIDKTITKIGRDSLQELVKAPITDIPTLEKRKATVKFWIENPALTDAIKAELHTFAKHEEMIEILWGPQDQICKTTLEDLYFDNSYLKHLNDNPKYLNLLQVANIGGMFAPLIEHMVTHFFVSKSLGEFLHLNCDHSLGNHNHDHHDHAHAHDHSHHHHDHTYDSLKRVAYTAYNVAHFSLHIYGIKQLYDAIKQKAAIAKALQSNLIAASRCLKSLKTVHGLLKGSSADSAEAAKFEQLNSFFESPESQSLITLLEKSTFQGAPSLLSNIGNILAAQTVIKENAHFRQAIEAMGDLDASISIATLYQEHQNTNTAYSFANYATSTTPYINAQGYWNPLIGSNQSTNNFAIGLHQPRVAVLTGSNNAGKSTNLKSIALIALLAQTYTIVPAQYVEITPFTKIGTFFKHSDSAGSSLFTTELIKANMLVDLLQTQQETTEFSLIVFDELFKSTSAEKGQDKAYTLIKYIGNNFKNCLCMVATHYAKLTILENENSSLFKNYTAQANPDAQGILQYALQEGSSLPSQTFDVLNNQGIHGIWEN